MKFWFAVLMAVAIVAGGCASKKPVPAKAAPTKKPGASVAVAAPVAKPAATEKQPAAEPKPIVTPENLLVGTVATYNTAGRFVVLDFPVGKLPAQDQTVFVYRQGLKVGEVKITGPERDHNTVGDVISGEARKGDEVRDK